jgi:hypothetical protein
MSPATFSSEESKKAFYEKHNKKVMEKYYSDPEYRQKLLNDRIALDKKHRELGIGAYSPERIAKRNEMRKIKYAEKKAKKLAEKVVVV